MNPSRRAGPRLPDCVADDWGMSPGVNEGILDLCDAGVVGGVSLLGSHEHLGHGMARLLRHKRLRLSLHLNLTHGPPLSPPEEVPSLCRPDGLFCDLPTLLRRFAGGRVSAEELRLEAKRQIRALKAIGAPPTGIEGHHHVHLIPPVLAAAAAVLREEGIEWIRLPVDPSHAPSRLAGIAFGTWFRFASPRASGRLRLQPTLYLNAADCRSSDALERKLLNENGYPVIVHPAKFNDLPRMRHPDPWQAERVDMFQKLLDWSRADRTESRGA